MSWQLLILGIVIGMGGWLLYWAGLPMIGAVIGGSFGGAIGFLASALVAGAWSIPIFTGIGLVLGGLAGILLVRALQIYFFFVTGLSLGAAVGYKLVGAHAFGLSPGSGGGWIFAGICAVVGGLVLVWGRRFIVAFVTSVVGAIITSLAFPPDLENGALLVALVFFLAVQIGLVHRFVDQEEFDRRTGRGISRRLRRREYPDVDSEDSD